MYCPKCKQTFEEGSRRFCPSDGARLATQVSLGARRAGSGIFGNLMSRFELDNDETFSDLPKFVVTKGGVPSMDEDVSGDFFVIEDVEAESQHAPEPVLSLIPEPVGLMPA